MADPATTRRSRVRNTDDSDALEEETSGSVAEAVRGRSRVAATVVVVDSGETWFGSAGVLVVVVVGTDACGVVVVLVVVGMSSSNTAEEASDMLVLEAVDVGDKAGVVVIVVGAAAGLVVVVGVVLLDVLGVLVVRAGDTVVVPPVLDFADEARGVTTAGMELVRSWRLLFRPKMRRNERVDWTDWASPFVAKRPPPKRVEVTLRRTLAFPFPELLRQDDRNRWANRKRRLRTDAVVEVVKVLASSANEEDEGSCSNSAGVVEFKPAPVVCCKRLTNLAVRRCGTFQVSWSSNNCA